MKFILCCSALSISCMAGCSTTQISPDEARDRAAGEALCARHGGLHEAWLLQARDGRRVVRADCESGSQFDFHYQVAIASQ